VFFNYLLPNSTVDTETLEPLEPLVFVNQSDLGMLSGLEGEENIFVAPAIVLKYADEKAWNQTASDVTMAAIDSASLATGYAEIKAGVSGLRRAWTLMDMTNSSINLTLNASLASQNARVKQLLEAYNLVTGGMAPTRMATGGIQSVYAQIKGQRIPKREDFQALLQALEEGGEQGWKQLSDADRASILKLVQRIQAEAQARGILNLEQQAQRVLEKLGKGVPDRFSGFANLRKLPNQVLS
jgi:hypothetical protein